MIVSSPRPRARHAGRPPRRPPASARRRRLRTAAAVAVAAAASACGDVPAALSIPDARAPDAAAADAAAPPVPTWPPAAPIPDAIDFPPWLTLPAPDRVVVSWRTVAPTRGGVRYTSDRGGGVVLSPSLAVLHQVELGPLVPGTRYRYEVFIDGTDVSLPGVFTTPGGSRWRFVHLAEFHAASEADHVARFTEAIRAFEPNAVVHSGDMCDSGDDLADWRSFFRTAAPWTANAFLLPAHSNHVNGPAGNGNALALFVLPDAQRWYHTRFGDTSIYTLDSTYDGANPDVGSAQLDWLRSTLAAERASTAPPRFVIGAWHYPACSSHYASRADQHQWVVDHILPAFADAGGVDLVLTGHDKYYERSTIAGGPVHVMANAGRLRPGSPGGTPDVCAPQVTDTATRSVGLYEVGPDGITAVVVGDGGSVIDQFSVP
ncbi:MAG: hypothetical protein D6689_01545 [Deltaproteobacteria bacterium]|nr:MAG: hypothetical protein D6689_01545 [Deltaproteobacteria bacterium]